MPAAIDGYSLSKWCGLRGKKSNPGTTTFDSRWTYIHQDRTPIPTQKSFMWLLNADKSYWKEWNISLSDGMGLLVKYREEMICSNLPPHIYFWILTTSHRPGLFMLLNHECLSQFSPKWPSEDTSQCVLKFLPLWPPSYVSRNFSLGEFCLVSKNRVRQDVFSDNLLA